MKVSELSGHNLDIWASKAEGCRRVHPFSSKWMLAGQIIEREGISVLHATTRGGFWYASVPDHKPGLRAATAVTMEGDTALEAAMRCYVASKFGEEVSDAIDN